MNRAIVADMLDMKQKSHILDQGNILLKGPLDLEIETAEAGYEIACKQNNEAALKLRNFWQTKFSLNSNDWLIPKKSTIRRLKELIEPLPEQVKAGLILPIETPIRYYLDQKQIDQLKGILPDDPQWKTAWFNETIQTSRCANFTRDMYDPIAPMVQQPTQENADVLSDFLKRNLLYYLERDRFAQKLVLLSAAHPQIAQQVSEIVTNQWDIQYSGAVRTIWNTAIANLPESVKNEIKTIMSNIAWCFFQTSDLPTVEKHITELKESPKFQYFPQLTHIATLKRMKAKALKKRN